MTNTIYTIDVFHHRERNYLVEKVHRQFGELLDCLSFKSDQLEYIGTKARTLLKAKSGESEQIISSRKRSIAEVKKKLDGLEEKFMNDSIDHEDLFLF